MSIIVPTILCDNINDFNRTNALYSTFAKRIQIDICDGEFVSPKTISSEDIETLQNSTISYDFHMMVKNPSKYLDKIISLKPNLVIFHAECSENLLPIFEKLKTAGIKTGVAILKSTFPGKIAPYIRVVDHVLVFAGSLGRQGGQADLMQVEKYVLIKNINKDVEIGWDGGINLSNIRELTHSGMDVLNIGSAISKAANTEEAFKELSAEADRKGVLL